VKRIIFLAITVLVLTARGSAAQGFISPFIGTTLTAPTEVGSHTKAGWGVDFGALGKIVGAETEIAWYPEIIDIAANAIDKSKVISFSGDMLIGPTMGAVKPYFAIGAGNLHLNVTGLSTVVVPNPTEISNNYFTGNLGGGVFVFFTKNLGVRGDLRYFKAYGFDLGDLQGAGLVLDNFNFWRGSIAFAAKF
jgi:hypothetical protein